ncbi:SCO3374 family protein [Streptomyces sp. NPDC014603]|uniref:SCO3374 family protein n=1 Tax=Streptomyces sp. NPDC014603 TaxID=3364873 RepID=UPI003702DB20
MVVTVSTGAGLPGPRRPLASGDRIRAWYENEQGWPTAPGPGPRLVVGVRFDVLDVPAEAGHAALAHFSRAGEDAAFPVAAQGGRLRLLVAPGSAEEVPGLLDWLEWGGLTLDLVAIGAGGLMDAPPPPGRDAPPGAAVWLRPPGSRDDVESSLPTLSAMGGRRCAADLARLVNTVATQCHRVRLRRAGAEPGPSGSPRVPGKPLKAFSGP